MFLIWKLIYLKMIYRIILYQKPLSIYNDFKFYWYYIFDYWKNGLTALIFFKVLNHRCLLYYILFNFRWSLLLMNKLLASTIWFVGFMTVGKMASCTAMTFKCQCVSKARTNIEKVQTKKPWHCPLPTTKKPASYWEMQTTSKEKHRYLL